MLAVLGDRERIARDLHDVVIQRLFAAGMQLQTAGAAGGPAGGPASGSTASSTTSTPPSGTSAARSSSCAVPAGQPASRDPGAGRAGPGVAGVPSGTADRRAGRHCRARCGAAGLAAVLTEALSNVARHAHATSAEVALSVGGGEIALVVADNGMGVGAGRPGGHGLANLRKRAEDLGGSFDVAAGPAGGTVLTWRVPA